MVNISSPQMLLQVFLPFAGLPLRPVELSRYRSLVLDVQDVVHDTKSPTAPCRCRERWISSFGSEDPMETSTCHRVQIPWRVKRQVSLTVAMLAMCNMQGNMQAPQERRKHSNGPCVRNRCAVFFTDNWVYNIWLMRMPTYSPAKFQDDIQKQQKEFFFWWKSNTMKTFQFLL